ncbi:hypothetical protein [Streptomyces meridianus]|uniref:Uncharacterized protein n=1 Tax=Streptomyces meridianus TaxID=2938945 RepID=A0ABT0XBF3_9ACTN|nr:hypothetical protein [Streptomyces meridianus]MCM2579847.1 hypothetical protein [Streptomyces meridianus]
MSNEREIGDADLTDITGGDEARARALRKTLQKLARSSEAGAPLQEMAREVLSGRIGLREAMRINAYAEALGERVAEGRRAYEALPPEELERQQEEARRYLDAQREEIEDERRGPASGPPGGPSRHDGGGRRL